MFLKRDNEFTKDFDILIPGHYKIHHPKTKHTQMSIEEIQTICRQLPGVTEDIKW
jgi:hypothetical protein